MIYTIVTKYDSDDSTVLCLATEDFELAKQKVTRYAEENEERNITIYFSAWYNGRDAEYGYSCKTHNTWRNSPSENMEVEWFIEKLSDKMSIAAELRDAENAVDLLERQLVQAKRKLAELSK